MRRRALAVLAAVAVMAAGCTPPAAVGGNAGGDTLVVYSNSLSDGRGDWLKQQAKAAGFTLQLVDLGGGDVKNRLIAEKASPIADVTFGLNNVYFEKLKEAGVLEPYTPSWAGQVDAKLGDPDGKQFWPIVREPIMLVWNKAAYPDPKRAPQDWPDLWTKTQFRQKYEVPSDLGGATAQVALAGILSRYRDDHGELGVSAAGWAAAKAYFANGNPAVKGTDLYARMASGTVNAGAMWLAGKVTREKQYKVATEAAHPAAGVPMTVQHVALVKGGKKTAAAQKFIDWFGGAELQAAWSKKFFTAPTNTAAAAGADQDAVGVTDSFTAQAVDWTFVAAHLTTGSRRSSFRTSASSPRCGRLRGPPAPLTPGTPMITLDDVTVRFETFEALPALSLRIEEGEFFTLLGPSGCGKTTALRTIAGFVTPDHGRVRIAGRDVTRLPSGKREVGMVFQNYALFPTMSVRENIAFGLTVDRRPRAEIDRRVDEIAARVDLAPGQLAKGVADLSGGQQQRVAIARALVRRPKVLLLDEPLSNLDAKLRQQLRVQLKELQSQFGITTVYVTHDQEEALSMSDRIAVLDAGKVEQVGTPEEIYDRAATEFVCTFIGEANRLSDATAARLGLDRSKHHYVRFEKVRLVRDGAPAGGAPMTGTVVARTFHGFFSRYRLRVGDGELQAVVPGHLDVGQDVTVVVDPADVLGYPA